MRYAMKNFSDEVSTVRKPLRAIRHGAMYSSDRGYKVGDVLRWVPSHRSWDEVEDKGLAVVIKAEGPSFTVFWLGDEDITSHDSRWGGFKLQDLAPMPEVAGSVDKLIRREYV